MIAVDTNILVRIFVEDETTDQVEAARKLASHAKKIFVPQIVQIELVWVLKTAFQLNKKMILIVLKELQHNDAFILQQTEIFTAAVSLYEQSVADFSDCVIAEEVATQPHCSLYTFDKKFATIKNVKFLKTE